MLKKELAALLGVSPTIVSRDAKRGMPTDTIERAQRWRKRHLEPGRVKGSRFDPEFNKKAPTLKESVCMPSLPILVERLNQALLAGEIPANAAVLMSVRSNLRSMQEWRTVGTALAMPVRVWLRLMSPVASDRVMAVANNLPQSSVMTAQELAVVMQDATCLHQFDASDILECACDLYSLDERVSTHC